MKTSILKLLELTSEFTGRADWVQGPGGNTSYKNENGQMFIKASGFRFDEMSYENGISAIHYEEVRKYFYSVVPMNKEKEEKQMLDLVSKSILFKEDGQLYPKPSMETGFHAVLDKFVVHTHSVWCNLFNCSTEDLDLKNKLIQKFNIAFIPFVTPGFGLSYLVTKEIKEAKANGNPVPELFLLQNHGVIAHSNDSKKCHQLLVSLDEFIQNELKIESNYPETNLRSTQENCQVPNVDFVSNYLFQIQDIKGLLNEVLFPDQTVFFKDQITTSNESNHKIVIDASELKIEYHCDLRTASSIHETMTAYCFIRKSIENSGMKLSFVKNQEIEYINNMDMEKHRKSIK